STNLETYPLVPPYWSPGGAAPARSLSELLDRYVDAMRGAVQIGPSAYMGGPALSIPVEARGAPHPADRLALGVLYHRLLTGQHRLSGEGFGRPAWVGGGVWDFAPHRGFEAAFERLARGVVPARGVDASVGEAEEALCSALCGLDAPGERIVELAAEAANA